MLTKVPASFIATTLQNTRFLKNECFNQHKAKKLYLWNQRDYGAPATLTDKQAFITICEKCLLAKLEKDPPRMVVPTLEVETEFPAEYVEPTRAIVSPDDLFKPKALRANGGATKYKVRE